MAIAAVVSSRVLASPVTREARSNNRSETAWAAGWMRAASAAGEARRVIRPGRAWAAGWMGAAAAARPAGAGVEAGWGTVCATRPTGPGACPGLTPTPVKRDLVRTLPVRLVLPSKSKARHPGAG